MSGASVVPALFNFPIVGPNGYPTPMFVQALNTLTQGAQAGTTASIAYGLASAPPTSSLLFRFVTDFAFTLPSDLAGLQGYAGGAPSVSTSFILQKNGAAIGSVTWKAGANTPTGSLTADVSFEPGDRLELVSPAAVNGMTDLSLTLEAQT